MSEFQESLWVDYPIPSSVSVWGDGEATANLDLLVKSCLKELQSDICLTESMTATSQVNYMPANTRNIISVRLAQPFQGNGFVKKTYDSSRNILMLRYFPAIVKYQVDVTLDNVHKLKGDMLRYLKAYILWKMSQKELVIITSIKLDADNGEVNSEVLKSFSDSQKTIYDDLKAEILMYVNQN